MKTHAGVGSGGGVVSELIQNTNSRHSYDFKLVGLSTTFYDVYSP